MMKSDHGLTMRPRGDPFRNTGVRIGTTRPKELSIEIELEWPEDGGELEIG